MKLSSCIHIKASRSVIETVATCEYIEKSMNELPTLPSTGYRIARPRGIHPVLPRYRGSLKRVRWNEDA